MEKYHKDEQHQNMLIKHRYISTGVEKTLVSRFYEVVVRGHYTKGRIDANAERIISRAIAQKAVENGYSGFSEKAFR